MNTRQKLELLFKLHKDEMKPFIEAEQAERDERTRKANSQVSENPYVAEVESMRQELVTVYAELEKARQALKEAHEAVDEQKTVIELTEGEE